MVFLRLSSPSCTNSISDNFLFSDFDVDGLDHAHGLGQVVLGLDGVFKTFNPSWTSFNGVNLLFGDFDVDGLVDAQVICQVVLGLDGVF